MAERTIRALPNGICTHRRSTCDVRSHDRDVTLARRRRPASEPPRPPTISARASVPRHSIDAGKWVLVFSLRRRTAVLRVMAGLAPGWIVEAGLRLHWGGRVGLSPASAAMTIVPPYGRLLSLCQIGCLTPSAYFETAAGHTCIDQPTCQLLSCYDFTPATRWDISPGRIASTPLERLPSPARGHRRAGSERANIACFTRGQLGITGLSSGDTPHGSRSALGDRVTVEGKES